MPRDMALNLIVPQIISRKTGKSIIAKAAYNSRTQLRDERTGETKDYSKLSGLEWQGIFLDPGRNNRELSEWMKDRQQLYNAYERKADESTRPNDAQLAREFLIALPHELNADQRRFLLTDFARELSRQGVIVDASIHKPHEHGDERNYHAHVLLGMYRIDEQTGQLSAKKERAWNKKEWYQKVHQRWSELGARYLERAGFKLEADRFRVGHLPREQQIERAEKRGDHAHAEDLRNHERGEHLGPQASAMERQGIETEAGNCNREITQRNEDRATLAALKRELAALDRQEEKLATLQHEFDNFEKALARKQRQDREYAKRDPVREQIAWEDAVAKAAIEKEKKERQFVERPARAQEARRPRFGDVLLSRAAETAMRDPRQEHGELSNAAFRDALEKNRLGLARVTPDEAAQGFREAKFAKELGRYAPVYQAGEIVVVREQRNDGNTSAGRVYKVDQTKAEDYLQCQALDKNQLAGIEATKRKLDNRTEMRQRAIEAAKSRKAAGPQRGGLVANQMWALRQIRDAEHQRLRAQEYRQREESEKKKRDGAEIDTERYRNDPEYRRHVQQTQSWKSPEDKQRDRDNAVRTLLEQQDRGR